MESITQTVSRRLRKTHLLETGFQTHYISSSSALYNCAGVS